MSHHDIKPYNPSIVNLSRGNLKFSLSTADLLTVVSDRFSRAFNKSGATRYVALNISKAFNRV